MKYLLEKNVKIIDKSRKKYFGIIKDISDGFIMISTDLDLVILNLSEVKKIVLSKNEYQIIDRIPNQNYNFQEELECIDNSDVSNIIPSNSEELPTDEAFKKLYSKDYQITFNADFSGTGDNNGFTQKTRSYRKED